MGRRKCETCEAEQHPGNKANGWKCPGAPGHEGECNEARCRQCCKCGREGWWAQASRQGGGAASRRIQQQDAPAKDDEARKKQRTETPQAGLAGRPQQTNLRGGLTERESEAESNMQCESESTSQAVVEGSTYDSTSHTEAPQADLAGRQKQKKTEQRIQEQHEVKIQALLAAKDYYSAAALEEEHCKHVSNRVANPAKKKTEGTGADAKKQKKTELCGELAECESHAPLSAATPVVIIANRVTNALARFWAKCEACQQHPEDEELLPGEPLVPWQDIPLEGRFRVLRPGGRDSRHHATSSEQLRDRKRYTKHVQWAQRCGLTLEDFERQVASAAAMPKHQRCWKGIAELLQAGDEDIAVHAVLACRDEALRKAAQQAGGDIGGDAVADEAWNVMVKSLDPCIFGSTRAELKAAIEAAPQGWREALRLEGLAEQEEWKGTPGLFEFWLRCRGASLMGEEAAKRWHHIARSEVAPPAMTDPFSLDDVPFQMKGDDSQARSAWLAGQNSLRDAWRDFAWEAVLCEVGARFGTEHKVCLHVGAPRAPAGDAALDYHGFTMSELCERLHRVPTNHEELGAWQMELRILHTHVHDKAGGTFRCPVCVGMGECAERLRRPDARRATNEWRPDARRFLWTGTMATVQRYGTGWPAWRPVRQDVSPTALPPLLELESVPMESVALKHGIYRWGKYLADASAGNLDEAWKELNARWQEDRQERIALQREMDSRPKPEYQGSRTGQKYTLQHPTFKEQYQGRLYPPRMHRWGCDEWVFQEEVTGMSARVKMEGQGLTYSQCALRDKKLLEGMNAVHEQSRQKRMKELQDEASRAISDWWGFIESHGRLPSKAEEMYLPSLWIWKFRYQGNCTFHDYGLHILPEVCHALEALPGWTWEYTKTQWRDGLPYIQGCDCRGPACTGCGAGRVRAGWGAVVPPATTQCASSATV